MAIPDDGTLQRLQIAEETYGLQVHDWVDEGMPADILGKTRDMEAFRQRQANRPPEVPTNIERQNRRSVLRSEQAAAEMESAGETGVPDAVREVISSSGRSLDASIQRAMEDRMGDSLGDVRIHTGPQAAAACESINARAFTVGNHVAFNAGEYDPESTEGQHVLAHELAHVRQQTQGAVSMLPQEDMELEVDPDPALEREAEETAQRVMAGGDLGIQRLAGTEVHVQRAGLGSLSSQSDRSPSESASKANSSTYEEVNIVVDEVTADPEALAEEVEQIKANQAKLFAEMAPDSAGSKVAKSSAKGAVGAVGGLIGAAAGSALLPGFGTLGGAAVGQEMAKGIAGDVTKTLTGSAYEKGSEVVSGKASDAKEYVDQLIEKKLGKYLDRSDTGSDNTKF
ncbi:DUF4157 domain-containing protein [Halohasta salina]|uniref:eCIS core domain-containing protein n=1 Tax=Halohasta salina TaxID=2961621 RepID=UPI0020A4318E